MAGTTVAFASNVSKRRDERKKTNYVETHACWKYALYLSIGDSLPKQTERKIKAMQLKSRRNTRAGYMPINGVFEGSENV